MFDGKSIPGSPNRRNFALASLAVLLRSFPCAFLCLPPLNCMPAAQHRLVNEQLAALAQRIHGFTVETVKPTK
jgi:hypothetical protein